VEKVSKIWWRLIEGRAVFAATEENITDIRKRIEEVLWEAKFFPDAQRPVKLRQHGSVPKKMKSK
jgi:hypothetical protein